MQKENFLIIGGTEKAGTTSLYEYFCGHPDIQASFEKETDYLRRETVDLEEYKNCFERKNGSKNYFEASPGYLSRYEEFISSIKKLSIKPRLVFIVRDPIERLISSFRFHKSKLYIPDSLDINEYIELCFAYQNKKISLDETIFSNSWFLEVVSAGKYEVAFENMSNEDIEFLLIDFSELNNNMQGVIQKICKYFQVEEKHFDNFDFHRANQTIGIKNRFIHRIGMGINEKFEPYFRRNPKVKQKILDIYKKVNGAPKEAININKENEVRLKKYYKETYETVNYILQKQNSPKANWRNFDEN